MGLARFARSCAAREAGCSARGRGTNRPAPVAVWQADQCERFQPTKASTSSPLSCRGEPPHNLLLQHQTSTSSHVELQRRLSPLSASNKTAMVLLGGVQACCLAVLVLLASSGFPVAANKLSTRGPVSPNSTKCRLCDLVASDVAGFAKNSTDIAKAISNLKGDCGRLFPNGTDKRAVCDDIVTGLMSVLPFAYKELSSLAWDSANLCAVAGICTVLCCAHATAPEQIHLALTTDPSEMAVTWTTLENTSTHVVHWGASPARLNHTSEGRPFRRSFSRSYTHFGWRGVLHTAYITGLSPDATVFYSVGDAAGGFSAPVAFMTLPTDAGTPNRPLRVASVGDMGYGNASDATIKRISSLVEAGKLDLILHNGDISYADGEYSHWDVFMRKISPIACRVPYLVTPGNHELYFNFSAYKSRFAMPDDGRHEGLYWGTVFGGVHFVGLDTESPADVAQVKPAQVSWLKEELTRTTSNVSWTIVMGHRPFYCSQDHPSNVKEGKVVLRRVLEKVLIQNKVRLCCACMCACLWGELHAIRTGKLTTQELVL